MSHPSGVLFLHGWMNRRPPEHWQSRVAAELRGDGIPVEHPQLPDPDTPRLEGWIDVALDGLRRMPTGERVVACHSLSCLLWAHLAPCLERAERPERVCWVAPPGPAVLAGEAAIADFGLPEPDAEAIRASSTTHPLRLVWSDRDPYCVEGAGPAYGEPLGLDAEFLPGQAHLNPDAGYGDWPAMTAWCLDGASRFRRGRP